MGRAKVLHSKKERLEIAQKICDMYAEGLHTIVSCCEACGVSESCFKSWLKQNNEIADFYNAAKKKVAESKAKERVLKMSQHLEVMAAGECKPAVTKELIEKKDADGNVMERIEKTIEREIPPNANAAITLLNAALRDLENIKAEAQIKEAQSMQPPNIIVERAETNEPCNPTT